MSDSSRGAADIFGPDPRQVILLRLGRSKQPLSVLEAQEELVAAGFEVSESTVARRLRALDAAGLTILLGKQGRVLTDEGWRSVESARVQRERAELIQIGTTVRSSQGLLDLMRMRRAVEPEIAHEAARYGTADDIRDLEGMNKVYRSMVERGGDLPRELALDFHRRLASVSRSPLVRAVSSMVLDPRLDELEAALGIVLQRHEVHADSAHEHEQILAAISAGDAPAAEQLMRAHLDSIVTRLQGLAGGGDAELLDRLLMWASR